MAARAMSMAMTIITGTAKGITIMNVVDMTSTSKNTPKDGRKSILPSLLLEIRLCSFLSGGYSNLKI